MITNILLLSRQLIRTSEFFLLDSKLSHQSRMGLPRRLDLKQSIHALKRNTLCLRHEEVHKEDGQDHQARKQEVDAETHGRESLWREARDDKVPEPVVASGECLSQDAHMLVVHLGVIHPWSTVP